MPTATLQELAQTPLLLVACDFDGTIAPIVRDPLLARIDPAAAVALHSLSELPRTRVAIISGRPLDWLRGALALVPAALLVGSHGAEMPDDPSPPASPLPAEARAEAERTAAALPGVFAEHKPFGIALHFRNAPHAEPAVAAAAARIAAAHPALSVRQGSMVIELSASPRHKGLALAELRYQTGATHAIFIGDDRTDEDAFSVLRHPDLAVKVGADESIAHDRVADVPAVAAFLNQLLERRAAWIRATTPDPIHAHSILSDQRTIAVVSPTGVINWLCLPRLDSAAIFGRLVGGPDAGDFAISPHGDPGAALAPICTQQYAPDSFILRTRWPTFTVTDYLDCSAGRAFQRPGRSDLIRVIEGTGRADIRFAPRLDFGRVPTRLRAHELGLEVEGGGDPIVLHAPSVTWQLVEDGPNHTAHASVDLDAAGGAIVLELRAGTSNLRPALVPESVRRAQTDRFWSGWASTLRLPRARRDLLARSALVLKALSYGPNGAIAAAATTSLPEQLGGTRNWDYRYCWPRDAAMSAAALLRVGNTGHAMRLADWLAAIVERLDSPDRLRPIYTLTGEDLGPEAEIAHLPGYAQSRPVRISNAASHQVQLDVFGPITDMVALMTERGIPVSPDSWRLVRAMVRAVETRWSEPDHGIWEIRGPRKHHVHSKVMCWHTLDRALIVHDAVIGRDNPQWRALRDHIAHDIFANGWNPAESAFVMAYDDPRLDAATLLIGLTGLVPHDDPRWISTVDAINRRLRRGPAVRRYLGDDGLPGEEGGFIIAGGWLAESLALCGRTAEAVDLFNDLARIAGPTGLLPEQWDHASAASLGNFPQAYSHLAILNAAVRLDALGAL